LSTPRDDVALEHLCGEPDADGNNLSGQRIAPDLSKSNSKSIPVIPLRSVALACGPQVPDRRTPLDIRSGLDCGQSARGVSGF
jgi:hypothetical protein